MRKKFISFALMAISGFAMSQMTVGAGNILYVKKGSTGNGSSWENAAGELSDALKWANDNKNNWTNTPLQIWVAAGTYLPKYSPEDGLANPAAPTDPRTKSFLVPNNVYLYGGFVGGETKINQRNWVSNSTILSGDFSNNDVVSGSGSTLSITNNTENAYRVVMAVANIHADPSIKGVGGLDGFTVKGANNDGAAVTINGHPIYKYDGGALLIDYTDFIVSNSIFMGNTSNFGAGINSVNSDTNISNTKIYNNFSGFYLSTSTSTSTSTLTGYGDGAALYFAFASPTVSNTSIYGNRSVGGGVISGGMGVVYSNVTIANNYANSTLSSQDGYIINNHYSSDEYNNVVLWNNSTQTGGIINNDNSNTVSFTNCILQGSFNGTTWNSSYGTNGGGNLMVDPQFTNPTTNDFTLKSTSPAIDTGNNTLYDLSTMGYLDVALKPRLRNNIVDRGAYEFQKGNIALNVNPSATNILYVKKGATGDGSSWTNALGEVADALYYANVNKANYTASSPLQIWVAAGTYLPKYSYKDAEVDQLAPSDPRMKTFFMTNNVKMYGGFLGNEANIDQRVFQWGNNSQEAVLSGDFLQNDLITGYGATLSITKNDENAYHVVSYIGDTANNFSNALLDGFRVGFGNASTNTVGQTTNSFALNSAYGGGITLYKANPLFRNLAVTRNTAFYDGAAFYLINSSPKIYNSVIVTNVAGYKGAALLNDAGSNPTLANVNIVYNIAPDGVVYNNNSVFTLNNSIMYGNITGKTNPKVSKATNFNSSTSMYKNSLLEGSGGSTAWDSTYGTSGGGNIDGDPKFLNVSNGDWNLLPASPAIDMGNNALYTSIGGNLQNDKDFISMARVYNYSSGGIIDMGAYEYQGIPPSLATSENNTIIKTLKIYPNPTSGFFYINSDKAQKAVLYNINGQIVHEFDLKVGENKQDISNLSAGLYLLKTSESTFKILKK